MKSIKARLHLYFLLLIILIKSFSCSKKELPKERVILASFYPIYIATLNVTDSVPGISVLNLASPNIGCLHDYQLTPEDLVHLDHASIFIVNGFGMEAFLDKVTGTRPNLPIILASKNIVPISLSSNPAQDLSKNTTPNDKQSLPDPSSDREPNPHVWVSISNAIQQVRNIAVGLASWDTLNAKRYLANAERYISQLDLLNKKAHRDLDSSKSRNIVTFHEAFTYFAHDFNLMVAGVVEREPGSEPSAEEMARTVETIRKLNVKAIFTEPQYPSRSAQTIARETGISVYVLDPVVTGPLQKDAYIKIMETNLMVLREALK